jgi:ribose 5-phosphate isomerase B
MFNKLSLIVLICLTVACSNTTVNKNNPILQNKTIALGSDNKGYQLKEITKAHLKALGYSVFDVGVNSADEKISQYEIPAHHVATLVASGKADLGFLFCKTGQGVNAAANSYANITSIILRDEYDATHGRARNNANIGAFGSIRTKPEEIKPIIDAFLQTKYTGNPNNRLSLGYVYTKKDLKLVEKYPVESAADLAP